MSRNQRRNRRNKSGGNQNANRTESRDSTADRFGEVVRHRSSTETKSSLKTTELIAYAAAVLAVIMTALAVDADDRGGGNDPFGADSAIRYITYLTIGYMVARGLAKSGSHENRVVSDTDDDVDPVGTVVADDEEDRLDDVDEQARDDYDDSRDSDADSVEAVVVPSHRGRQSGDDLDTRP